MSPNILANVFLDTSATQLRHKWQKIDCENRNDTAPPTPALNDQILTRRNGRLMSPIAYNSQGNMVVWWWRYIGSGVTGIPFFCDCVPYHYVFESFDGLIATYFKRLDCNIPLNGIIITLRILVPCLWSV